MTNTMELPPMGFPVMDAINDQMSLPEVAERIHGKIPPGIQAVIETCRVHGWSTDPFLPENTPEALQEAHGKRHGLEQALSSAVILPHELDLREPEKKKLEAWIQPNPNPTGEQMNESPYTLRIPPSKNLRDALHPPFTPQGALGFAASDSGIAHISGYGNPPHVLAHELSHNMRHLGGMLQEIIYDDSATILCASSGASFIMINTDNPIQRADMYLFEEALAIRDGVYGLARVSNTLLPQSIIEAHDDRMRIAIPLGYQPPQSAYVTPIQTNYTPTQAREFGEQMLATYNAFQEKLWSSKPAKIDELCTELSTAMTINDRLRALERLSPGIRGTIETYFNLWFASVLESQPPT